jgi:NAD(P)-dependent dehydrogenase (short-subunit alcohol dehydrogenase family)
MKKVLITGAGTGFGHEVAMRLARKGFDVIAAVEIYAQVQTLKREAAARGVALQVEKLDVTNEGDRKKALAWNIEILVNNAGVLEGGSVLDIPGANMRHEFEVNVIGPLLLTQGIAKQTVKRGKGRIVWVSSREGLNVNPFTGIYSASKHAVEAVAETMSLELQEFGIEVATINPGPFLTGFNDRGFETWKSWSGQGGWSSTGAPMQRRVAGGSEPSRGQEEVVQRQRRHTSPRRCEARRQCGVWASDFMQPWPGAVENGVGVVPP